MLKPATELATKVSAICLRASRPVGLFPFLCCSWMRLSNSSLKAWRRRRGRETEPKHTRTFPSDRTGEYLTTRSVSNNGRTFVD